MAEDRRFSLWAILLLGCLRALFSSLMLAWCFCRMSSDLSKNCCFHSGAQKQKCQSHKVILSFLLHPKFDMNAASTFLPFTLRRFQIRVLKLNESTGNQTLRRKLALCLSQHKDSKKTKKINKNQNKRGDSNLFADLNLDTQTTPAPTGGQQTLQNSKILLLFFVCFFS